MSMFVGERTLTAAKQEVNFYHSSSRKRMGSLDVTIKNEDNHETNMLSSDDYNAYHGGMIAAVRSIKGLAPRSYCGDSTDKSKVVMHSVQEEAKRIFRSEAVNPKFIEGMMKHGYKGAADMANYIAHSFPMGCHQCGDGRLDVRKICRKIYLRSKSSGVAARC